MHRLLTLAFEGLADNLVGARGRGGAGKTSAAVSAARPGKWVERTYRYQIRRPLPLYRVNDHNGMKEADWRCMQAETRARSCDDSIRQVACNSPEPVDPPLKKFLDTPREPLSITTPRKDIQ